MCSLAEPTSLGLTFGEQIWVGRISAGLTFAVRASLKPASTQQP